ncbi:MAG: 3-hydroxybutyryl-CoA dehydrogenase [Gemmatimonadota bacterium]
MKIETVGVVGCGLMGSGIAEVAARAGFHVRVHELDAEALERGRKRIVASLDRAVEREHATPEERDEALARIHFDTTLELLADRDLVVEAIVEELGAKEELFRSLDDICPAETLFATNTSSLTVTELAAATERPAQVLGLHFFNPVPVMKLVEVVRTLATGDEVVARAMAFVERLGKVPVEVGDRSGFVVNLLLVPYMLDAIRQLERGVAPVEVIDQAMTLGAGQPMGPFTLCDFVGLDTTLRIAGIMYDEYRETRYAPPPLLRRMVTLGRLGRKSGMGFYDYRGEEPVPLPVG